MHNLNSCFLSIALFQTNTITGLFLENSGLGYLSGDLKVYNDMNETGFFAVFDADPYSGAVL